MPCFNPRTYMRCDLCLLAIRKLDVVSIRTPTKGAMATRSKIRPLRAPSHPLSPQNRHNLENPFSSSHPCVRHLREKTHRFYDHFGFAIKLSIGSSHHYLCCGCKISVVRTKRPSLAYPVAQPSDAFNLTRQSIASPSLSFGPSTRLHLQKV